MSDDAHQWEQVAELHGGRPVADLRITPQISLRCHVGQFLGTAWPLVTVDQWINENHLIWTLCAALAAHGQDSYWTRSFEDTHGAQWDQIQASVEQAQGADRFLLAIPPPPLALAVFRNSNRTAGQNHVITATPAGVPSNGGLLDFLRYVYHGGVTLADVFIVALHGREFTGLAAISPPYAPLGLPDPNSDVPVLVLPPAHGDDTPLPPYRDATPPPRYSPPPPYNDDSFAPPDGSQ
ncbi:uncharacterized protein N7500_001023 [Penicillium coprophilum]|uniref:uncharacterized protein n=1 Tax=Penicillium coprophilum TaxID=36646 RepID=UPI00239B2D32|nr:uncharacterized protein N7500_001023 [Penicillium coprophilum]KAJ5178324.1 hypothetical protein N7500_001023 [Penicillium coprophilum]